MNDEIDRELSEMAYIDLAAWLPELGCVFVETQAARYSIYRFGGVATGAEGIDAATGRTSVCYARLHCVGAIWCMVHHSSAA